ncbi:MAG: peptidase U32 [Candidatus Omnitrophica bacterium]|nr:peptidase U32 [Candidatus Omnitrophota bacterium]
MKFSVPTNWQEGLLPVLTGSPSINEVYGKLAEDFVGGGRPAYSVFDISRKNAARHINEIRKTKRGFNYLLNASCLGGREFTNKGKHEIAKLLDWLVAAGVDSVTVSLPFLAEMIKRKSPSLKISVSVMAHVDSIEKARFWDSIGADSITLSHTKLNRDFVLLKELRKAVKCGLRLMANNHCLYHCPFQEHHEAFSSHASQKNTGEGSFAIDYCSLNCKISKISFPHLLISAPWIRPEDISVYEKIGIDSIKLVDRRLPTPELARIINAYVNGEYKGNLVDLFPTLSGASRTNRGNFLARLKNLLKLAPQDIIKLVKSRRIFETMEIKIDNQALDGFLDFFFTHDCRLSSCVDCGYCFRIADKAVKIDPGFKEKMISDSVYFTRENL